MQIKREIIQAKYDLLDIDQAELNLLKQALRAAQDLIIYPSRISMYSPYPTKEDSKLYDQYKEMLAKLETP